MWKLYAFFFVSGIPALIYQVVWQRSLFEIYGVNNESITVVVAAFLLGLGIGSVAGGRLTRQSRIPLLVLFGAIELAIGAFGFASLGLFETVGQATLGANTVSTFFLSFGLVVVPTVLMGATLPILVEYLVRTFGNVGSSVGILYAVNTFGSAAACFAVSIWLLRGFGQAGTVALAAVLNLVVAAGAIAIHLRGARARKRAVPVSSDEPLPEPRLIPFPLALVLVVATGFISLSYEILWARVYSFLSGSAAATFAMLLGAFLVGIAAGSLLARRYCRGLAGDATHLIALARFLLLANAVAFVVVPVVVLTAGFLGWRWTATLGLVAVAAALLGATFPLLCHAAIAPDRRAGTRTSYMYVANIVGSVAGTLVTGFWLFDALPMQAIAILLPLVGLALGVAVYYYADVRGAALGRRFAAAAVGAVAIVLVGPLLLDHAWERLQLKHKYDGQAFATVVETRSGVITVDTDGKIYGGGIYDGAFSTDLVDDVNGILRPYAISLFHPAPRDVLMIGLSSGSWAAVLANHPQVESLTIVEINPGYLRLIASDPEVSKVLNHPKVEIVIDDGRRWLAANDRKFDLTVSNNTFAWRSHASNLLSVEFFDLIRAHLKPGGVHYFNSTASVDALFTACKTFGHALRISTMLACSDAPLQVDVPRWRRTLADYTVWGKPVFDRDDPRHRERLDEVVATARREARDQSIEELWVSTESRDKLLARTRGAVKITDDNMGIEWRTPPPWPIPNVAMLD